MGLDDASGSPSLGPSETSSSPARKPRPLVLWVASAIRRLLEAAARSPYADQVRRSATEVLARPRWFDASIGRPRFRLSLERGALLLGAALFATGLVTTVATALGAFRIVAPLLLIAWSGVLLALVVAIATRSVAFEGDRTDVVGLGLALLVAVSAGFFHHHYFAAQADIGFYVTDAAAIAETGSRVLTGPYDHLLPGFNPGGGGARLSAMFGYSSLAALFAYAWGPFAVPWINLPLAFVTTAALYRVGRHLGARSGAILGVLFFATSLITVWLTRWTMTENAAAASFWAAVVLALLLWKKWDSVVAAGLGLALGYGALVRPEGIVVLVWFALLFALRYDRPILAFARKWAPTIRRWREHRKGLVVAAGVALLLVPLGIAVVRALPVDYLGSSFRLAGQFLRGRPGADALDVPTTGIGPNWGDYALRYEWESAVAYYLPWFLLVALLGLALRLLPWRSSLLLIGLSVPYLIFVMIPPVTTAHPWFMRRLWVAFIPLLYILAGATLDIGRNAWRWPIRMPTRNEPRLRSVLVASLVIALLLSLNLQVVAPVALKREQDSVQPLLPTILALTPPGAAVILDEDVVEYASMIRFEHDGPVVPWFNQRKASFFASIEAADQSNGSVLVRVPTQGRHYLETDAATSVVLLNATIENAPRRDFRSYIASPPLRQGYDPLRQYLESEVPPNEWRVSDRPFQVINAVEPLFLQKNIRITSADWVHTTIGLAAAKPSSSLTIDLTKFRQDVLESVPLALHIVYVQSGPDRVVTSPGRSEPLGILRSDGSGTVRSTSILLPVPMTLTVVQMPQNTVLRGILLDLP